MKVAIPCPGIGHVRRGFESFAVELAEALRDDAQIAVYSGGSVPSAHVPVHVIPTIKRTGKLSSLVVPSKQRYRVEQFIFAVTLSLALKRNQCDIVHVSDSLVSVMLMRLRRRLGLRFRLVFSNGGNRDPQLLRQFDLCQVLTPIQYDDAVKGGVSAERAALVPYAVNCQRFMAERLSRATARARLNIPENMKVILSVAPLDFSKRLDYLIDELGALNRSDVFLLAAGQPYVGTEALEAKAKALLPRRYRFVTLPHSEIELVYRAADLFTLTSLREGFGIVVLEAMAAGIPAVVHDWPLFQWLVPNPMSRIDMTAAGALGERIGVLLDDEHEARRLSDENRENVLSRFDWPVLRPTYLEMYEQALARPALR